MYPGCWGNRCWWKVCCLNRQEVKYRTTCGTRRLWGRIDKFSSFIGPVTDRSSRFVDELYFAVRFLQYVNLLRSTFVAGVGGDGGDGGFSAIGRAVVGDNVEE